MNRRIDLPPFPNSWYRVAASADVHPGSLLPLRAFGQDYICYRGETGAVHVLDAYCAHLGANIGVGGFVDGDNVVCPFHHWRYDGDGRNVQIPYRDKPNRAARLGCLRTIERNDHVLVWYSADGRTPDWEPPAVAEPDTHDYVRVESGEWMIKSHVQEIFENTVDVSHFQYVHGTPGFGSVELVEDGPMFRSTASVTMKTPRGNVDGAIESELWGLGYDIVRQRGIGDARIIFAVTPIEDTLVRTGYTFLLPRDPETGEASRYGQGLMRDFSRQITQDIPIWENKVYRPRPRLAIGENAIGDYRRWAEQFYAQTTSAAS
jgi:phenylpropionate dioxygenase-like ring-hydroxylating dioxygenase large terminal subunit